MHPGYIRTFLKAEVVLHPHLCVVIMVIIFLKKNKNHTWKTKENKNQTNLSLALKGRKQSQTLSLSYEVSIYAFEHIFQELVIKWRQSLWSNGTFWETEHKSYCRKNVVTFLNFIWINTKRKWDKSKGIRNRKRWHLFLDQILKHDLIPILWTCTVPSQYKKNHCTTSE